jgi:hypothetical protein
VTALQKVLLQQQQQQQQHSADSEQAGVNSSAAAAAAAAAGGLSVDSDVAAEEAWMRKLLLHRTGELRWPYC